MTDSAVLGHAAVSVIEHVRDRGPALQLYCVGEPSRSLLGRVNVIVGDIGGAGEARRAIDVRPKRRMNGGIVGDGSILRIVRKPRVIIIRDIRNGRIDKGTESRAGSKTSTIRERASRNESRDARAAPFGPSREVRPMLFECPSGR